MNSPVGFLDKNFIVIDKDSATSVYLQIAQQLIIAIQRAYLSSGTKLPGTRSLSETLQVHRKTIIAAYEELDAQGWVETIPNKGTFVLSENPTKTERIKLKNHQEIRNTYPLETGFHFRKSNFLDNPFEKSDCNYLFNDGTPDIRLTQIDQLSRFYSSNLKRKSNRKKLGYYNAEGSEYLKQNLSQYLNITRGLHISKNNLLITRSTEMSIFILSEILLSKNDIVLVGNPSYFSVNMIFQQSGAQIIQIPTDEDGIVVEEIRQLCKTKKIRLLYLTPHHHYPTTVTLSAQRRMELLALAHEYGFIILEDDYDYDFNYDKSVVLPMASADINGMVIYMGSFGKSLAPGFRTGFIVAPENLMQEMRKHLGMIDRQGDILMEQALGEMIEEGEIHRHIKKSLKVYKERRDLFANLLTENFSNEIELNVPSGGLAFWLKWKQPLNLLKLAGASQANDLFIPKTLLYQNKNLTAMRLGFGHLNETEMHESLRILKETMSGLNDYN